MTALVHFNFRGPTTILGMACVVMATSLLQAQEPPQHCPPGKVWNGGHPVYKPISFNDPNPPIVWINGGCIPIPPPPFKGVSFNVIPTYMLMTIIYAPPGNQSEVTYGAGSSIGAKTETRNSYKAGLVVQAETNFGEIDAEALQGQTTGSAVELKKEQTSTLSSTSQTDTSNADNDLYFLWMNPEVQVVQTGPNTIITTYRPAEGNPVLIVPISVGELRDPSKIPGYKRVQLSKLTNTDFQNLLALDPRVASVPPFALDPQRFVGLHTSLQLDGPYAPGATIPGEGVSVSTENVNTAISGRTYDVSVSILVGGEVSWGIVAKFMAGAKFEWNYEGTNEASTGQKQEADLTLRTSTVGYHDVVDVYFDTLFNSFLLASEGATPLSQTMLTGTVLSHTGDPVRNKRIVIRLPDNSTRILFTDSRGQYNVYRIPSGNVELNVDGHKETTAVSAAKTTSLNITLPR